MSITVDRHPEVEPTRPAGQHAPTAGSGRLSTVVLANVVLLTMMAPLATDMYVPAFP